MKYTVCEYIVCNIFIFYNKSVILLVRDDKFLKVVKGSVQPNYIFSLLLALQIFIFFGFYFAGFDISASATMNWPFLNCRHKNLFSLIAVLCSTATTMSGAQVPENMRGVTCISYGSVTNRSSE